MRADSRSSTLEMFAILCAGAVLLFCAGYALMHYPGECAALFIVLFAVGMLLKVEERE